MGPQAELSDRRGPRGPRRILGRDQRGQLLVMWLIFMLPLVVICFGVFNVGFMASEKMKVQTAADNAAYSAATWNARYMNQVAYLNRAMVANYDTIAAFTGIWSFVDATDGFVGVIRTILRAFFNIGEAITPAAQALHQVNRAMSEVIGGGKKNPRLGRYLEGYSRALSFAQQGLYIANQIGRARVAQTVAWGVDPQIQYWLPSEGWNVQEMGNRRDWKESDEQKGLRLTIERSLNALSNGGSFRDADNFPVVGTLLNFINLIPCFELTVGPEGFDGPAFNHVTGVAGGKGDVTIVRPEKIYQNDFNGLKVEFDCIIDFTLVEFGHNSDDALNLPNAKNLAFPHFADEEGDHGADFIQKNVECTSFSGPKPDIGAQDPKFQQLSALNERECGQSSDPFKMADVDGDNPPDLPPGPGFPIGANEQARQAANAARAAENPPRPPIPLSVITDDRLCSSIQNELEDRQKALTENLKKGFKASGNPCATIYEFQTPLAQVKVTHYVERNQTPDGKRVEGPSVIVYMRKPASGLRLFRGLGLFDGQTNVEAYAFGRAYYTQRPNNATAEKETAFNPFWAGRLEKAPILLH
jgi:Flp pilus assembly protein TadG